MSFHLCKLHFCNAIKFLSISTLLDFFFLKDHYTSEPSFSSFRAVGKKPTTMLFLLTQPIDLKTHHHVKLKTILLCLIKIVFPFDFNMAICTLKHHIAQMLFDNMPHGFFDCDVLLHNGTGFSHLCGKIKDHYMYLNVTDL